MNIELWQDKMEGANICMLYILKKLLLALSVNNYDVFCIVSKLPRLKL